MMKYNEEFKDFYRKNFNKEDMSQDNTIIVLDTNALLNIFRFSPDASDAFLNTIISQKEWLFIPYFVALEFHFNKKGVMIEYEEKVETFKKSFESKWKKIPKELSNLFDSFSFREGNTSSKQLSEEFAKEISSILESKKTEIQKETYKKVEQISGKQIQKYQSLVDTIESKTSLRPTQTKINEVEKEGEKRYSNSIPPGYNDNSKKDKRCYNGICYQMKYGDLLIWKDMLEKATESQIKNVIFVTSDGQSKDKSDLLHKVNNKIIGPRVELIEEMRVKSNANLFIMNESDFINKFSEQVDNSRISDQINLFYLNQKNRSKGRNENHSLTNSSEVYTEKDLISKMKNSAKIEEIIIHKIADYLHNSEFELNDFPVSGWGEYNYCVINDIEIDEVEFDFQTINGTATIHCDVDFDRVSPSPVYESGDPDNERELRESASMGIELSCAFNYSREYNKIEIDEIEIL